MADVTSITADTWATTAQVQDRVDVQVGGSEPDFEQEIKDATDEMQARWADATGGNVDSPPSDPDELLQHATAYLAASEQHLKFAANVSGDNQGDEKHIFLEQKADDKFQKWRMVVDLRAEDDPSEGGTGAALDGYSSSSTDDIID